MKGLIDILVQLKGSSKQKNIEWDEIEDFEEVMCTMKGKVDRMNDGKQRMKEDITSVLQLLYQIMVTMEDKKRSMMLIPRSKEKWERFTAEVSHDTLNKSKEE